MKRPLTVSVMAILMALMFLMGQDVIPQWLVFEYAGFRLAIFGVAFMVFCYQVGWWPTGDHQEHANN